MPKTIINEIVETDDIFRKSKSQANYNIFESDKFTVINDDCMQSIFQHLDLDDLLSITATSKRFHNAAVQTFRRKYKNIDPVIGKT